MNSADVYKRLRTWNSNRFGLLIFILLQATVQSLAINAEDASCFRTVSLHACQYALNVLLFHGFQRMNSPGVVFATVFRFQICLLTAAQPQ